MTPETSGQDRHADPRRQVTPDAFAVAPELLGLPLAGHVRRVAAILVDIALVGFLSLIGWLVLGIAASLMVFRLAFRGAGNRPTGSASLAMRGAVGFVGSVILFVTIAAAWGGFDRIGERGDGTGSPGVGLAELGQGFGAVQRFRGASDAPEAEAQARAVVEWLGALGVTNDEEVRQFLREMAPGDASWLGDIAGWELASGPVTASTSAAVPADLVDSSALADTLPTPDRAAELEDALETIDRLRSDVALATAAREETGPRGWLRQVAEDLGLGLGWGALFFTVFTTVWKGRTPGKRLFGLRVVRLDGSAITWWGSLERYGGYAAGFATGLLGFLQVLWDANRQATHDKIAGTVVIREP
ncbi:MAG: RDD family protein [Gemmatimonadota bacterium]